jgi:hypothetical protein
MVEKGESGGMLSHNVHTGFHFLIKYVSARLINSPGDNGGMGRYRSHKARSFKRSL